VHRSSGKTPAWLAELRRLNGDARPVVERLLLRALCTLRSIPDADQRWFHLRCRWPPYRREFLDAYGWDDEEPEDVFVPTPVDLDRYLTVLGWGVGLNGQQWLIVRDVAMGYSMAAISDRLHLPAAEIRRRYDLAIDAVHRRACAG
jgi:hypothetical protein